MNNDIKRLLEMRQQGYCCAQVMVAMGLEARGEDDPEMVRASRGLCGGVRSGLLCGALSGACVMLSYYDDKLAEEEMIPELVRWFQKEYGANGTDCNAILQGDPTQRARICTPMIERTYCEARDILEDNGFDMTSAFDVGD